MKLKRASLLVLTLLLMFSLMVGCAPRQNQQPQRQGDNTPQEQTQQPPKAKDEVKPREDGIYTAKGEKDERGWTPIATIIVRDGKIENVFFDEVDEENKTLKSFDAQYAINMKKATDELPYTAGTKLSVALKEVEDPAKVDKVSGATGTSDTFRDLTTKALETQPKPFGETFPDGIYKAESPEDERGYKGLAAILIDEGKISVVEYDEYNEKENSFKSYDEEYAKKMKEKTGVTPKEAVDQLIAQLKEKEDPKDVDIVAGATGTSDGFKDLMTKIFSYIK